MGSEGSENSRAPHHGLEKLIKASGAGSQENEGHTRKVTKEANISRSFSVEESGRYKMFLLWIHTAVL